MKFIVAIVLLILVTPAISDQSVLLRANYESLIGVEIHSELYMNAQNGNTEIRHGDMVFRGTSHVECESETTVTFQSKERYEYIIDSHHCSYEYSGEPENSNSSESSELLGETTVVEKIGNMWRRRLVGGVPSIEQEHLLRRQESRYDVNDLYPDRPVTVGDVWEIPIGALPIVLDGPLVNVTGTGTGRLQEFVDYGGIPSALIVMEGRFKGKSRDVGDGNTETWDATILVEEYRSLKDRISIYKQVEGEFRASQETIEAGQKLTVTISGSMVFISTESID
jgi:hypothetical protein